MAMAQGKMRLTHFTVQGTWAFPMDMLRYDACWPRDAESADKIGWTVGTVGREEWMKPRDIELATWAEVTPDRWQSFMWKVVKTDVVR